MLFRYKGSRVVASSRKEAISKIIAGKELSKEDIHDILSVLNTSIQDIDGVKSTKIKFKEDYGEILVNLSGTRGRILEVSLEPSNRITINFSALREDGKDSEYHFNLGKNINKNMSKEINKIEDCISSLIKASRSYDLYKSAISKWDNR